MSFRSWIVASVALVNTRVYAATTPSCKCAPTDSCWPSTSQWNAFNTTVSGKLIADTPLAQSCYPGPAQNAEACAAINIDLTNQTFIAETAIGLSYPTESCPPVNVTAKLPLKTCSIGDQPRYTVNATEVADVVATVEYASQKNLRLVVRNTGHDILRRSTGYGSLQIWIHYLRKGIQFQPKYKTQCASNTWNGAAFSVGGGYTWEDVYPLAAANKVVVVGGGTPSVSVLGGWMQGGGHGPAAHNFGLGADQVLEAQVVLASGEVVTASACQNQDLFFAIRGGGPSTYGVVVSTVIKAHPTTSIATQVFGFAPLTSKNMPEFMEAVNIMYQSYPDLLDAGFNGYGSWSIYSPQPTGEGTPPTLTNYTTTFLHTVANFGKTTEEAEQLFGTTMAKLAKYNGSSLFFINNFYSSPDYADYYTRFSGIVTPVGTTAALGSRLLDRTALTDNTTALKTAVTAIAGKLEEATSNNLILMGGNSSQIFKDEADPNSGVLPAWRKMYVHNVVARGWLPGSDDATINAVYDDITDVKVKALKTLAPGMGSYMNEGDRNDPDYLIDFYGSNAQKLADIKKKYDPNHLFYCPTCIGSDDWNVQSSGKICRKR
ncbi:hypothetical protein ACLMJK_003278 [Lecanora helva]